VRRIEFPGALSEFIVENHETLTDANYIALGRGETVEFGGGAQPYATAERVTNDGGPTSATDSPKSEPVKEGGE
jgi:hypothetical protein